MPSLFVISVRAFTAQTCVQRLRDPAEARHELNDVTMDMGAQRSNE